MINRRIIIFNIYSYDLHVQINLEISLLKCGCIDVPERMKLVFDT